MWKFEVCEVPDPSAVQDAYMIVWPCVYLFLIGRHLQGLGKGIWNEIKDFTVV